MLDKGEIGVCGHNCFFSVPFHNHCGLDLEMGRRAGQWGHLMQTCSSPVLTRVAYRWCDGFLTVSRRWCLLLLGSCGPVTLGSLNQYKNGWSLAESLLWKQASGVGNQCLPLNGSRVALSRHAGKAVDLPTDRPSLCKMNVFP